MQHFLETYQRLNATNLDTLAAIYTPDIHFIDPVHEVKGLPELTAYFLKLYENITTIEFEFAHPVRLESEGYVQWHMRFRHPKIKRGEAVTVPGATFLKFASDTRVCFHRDYFDLGSMIYRHVPILGKITAQINRRLGS